MCRIFVVPDLQEYYFIQASFLYTLLCVYVFICLYVLCFNVLSVHFVFVYRSMQCHSFPDVFDEAVGGYIPAVFVVFGQEGYVCH